MNDDEMNDPIAVAMDMVAKIIAVGGLLTAIVVRILSVG